ncbi:MAG: hypothetical protein J6K48_03755 [Lachnospiraceae bacterium]|nr:hypothetical protein [Lachnospiraceae bacterium]
MRSICYKIPFNICVICICVFLTGCTVGEYTVADSYVDENGKHFMLVGKHSESTDKSSTEESEDSSEKADMESDSLSGETMTETESSSEKTDIESEFHPESITGVSLKRGWTSSDSSILKGKTVLVKENSDLLSITLDQDKEVTISYDIVLDDGEYQLVYLSPEKEERVLQDGKIIAADEKISFAKGENRIVIKSDNAVFNEIDISITGIETSDFE